MVPMSIVGICYNGQEPQGAVSPTATNCDNYWTIHSWAYTEEFEEYDEIDCRTITVDEVEADTEASVAGLRSCLE